MDDAEQARRAKYGQLPPAVRPEDTVTTKEPTPATNEPPRGLAAAGPGTLTPRTPSPRGRVSGH